LERSADGGWSGARKGSERLGETLALDEASYSDAVTQPSETPAVPPATDDPVDPLLEQLSALMEQVARYMPRMMRGAQPAVDFDLTPHQFLLLRLLETHGPTNLATLRKHLGGAQSTTSEMVGRLVKLGYLEKRTDPDDSRAVVVAATDRGRAVIDARRQHMRAKHRQVLEKLSPDERMRFISAFETVVTLMGAATSTMDSGGDEHA